MNVKAHTTSRLWIALALATAVAALVVPAGSAASSPAAFATDTTNSARVGSSHASAVSGFATDTTNSARIASKQPSAVPGFSTDTTNSARVERGSVATAVPLPFDFVTDTVDTARVGSRQLLPAVSGGLDWGSFGIGIGAGMGVLVALLALGAVVTRGGKLRRLASA